mmetsp:Transcript_44280/g.146743  ORF Transcript_44280/g.146743 Transcript_44280/m.146743 type:complete len:292 (-) Transcript_44280:653-1528(-)
MNCRGGRGIAPSRGPTPPLRSDGPESRPELAEVPSEPVAGSGATRGEPPLIAGDPAASSRSSASASRCDRTRPRVLLDSSSVASAALVVFARLRRSSSTFWLVEGIITAARPSERRPSGDCSSSEGKESAALTLFARSTRNRTKAGSSPRAAPAADASASASGDGAECARLAGRGSFAGSALASAEGDAAARGRGWYCAIARRSFCRRRSQYAAQSRARTSTKEHAPMTDQKTAGSIPAISSSVDRESTSGVSGGAGGGESGRGDAGPGGGSTGYGGGSGLSSGGDGARGC